MRVLIYAFIWHVRQRFSSLFIRFSTDFACSFRRSAGAALTSNGMGVRDGASAGGWVGVPELHSSVHLLFIYESTCTRTMDKVFDMYFSIVITAISL